MIAGDIVRVRFPHVERAAMVSRPALVLTVAPIGPDGLLIWTLMITNAVRPAWPGDVDIPDADRAGLPIPSKVRTAKITAAEAAAAVRMGRLDPATWAAVLAQVRTYLPSSRSP